MKKNRILSLLLFLVVAFGAFAAQPKYIFYFIGDGMGMGHVMSAQTYNRDVLKKDSPLLMMQFPVASMAMTYSYMNPITDSAAAGTALATGHKTTNGMLGMTPDSVAVENIAHLLQKNGYGIGITTSVPIDDATPAAFFAHQPSRSMFTEISMDMVNSGYDFLAGSKLRSDKKDEIISALKNKGYSVVEGIENFNSKTENGKVLLLNPKTNQAEHIGFTIDSIKGALTLPQITKAAIEHLEKVSPKKFFLMVEGGNIDWAAHSNDGGTVVKEILNFDQSLKLAYDFYLKHPDETLIIVTADHDTGGMTVGVKKGPKVVDMKYIDYQRISKEAFSNLCTDILKSGKTVSWDEMKGYLKEYFGLYSRIPVSKEQDDELKGEFEEVFEKHNSRENKTLYASFSSFVEDVFDLLEHKSGFGWTTNSHTGNPVPVFVIGADAKEFSNLNNNIDIPKKIAKITGIKLP